MAENINKKKLYVEDIGDVVSMVALLLTLPVISAAFINIVKNLIALIMPKNLFADSNKSKVGNFVTNTMLPKIQIAIDNIDKWATSYIDGLVFVLKKIPKLKTKDESELRHIAITIYYTITIGLLMKVAKLILYKKGLIGDGAALKSIRDIITNGLKLGSYDLDFDDIEKESDIMFSTKGLAPIIKEIVDFFLKQLHITEDTYNHMNKNLTNETFKKHLGLLNKKLQLNEGIFEPDDDSVGARLGFWLDQNSSGYTSSFEVDTILNDLDIKKDTPEFNELVDEFEKSGYELKGNDFVRIVKKVEKGSGVTDKEVKDTANQYIKHFGKGSSSLQMSARDFVDLSQGEGDSDIRDRFPNWSDENFKQLLDILYTDGGLKRPVDETFQKHLKLLHKKLNESMSIEDLATVSDEALDNAYHYGRSTPGNTFGWQANLKSAEFAKRVIDAGVTDIEKISDAIHSGWNETAKKFVANPDQFTDTQKLRDNGKLDAKIEQRRKLSNVNYSSLPEEEKEKDRVVARALLNAIQTP